ncbi:hypothetical protein [Microscilla marina]|uniref:Lipoprotein, putative n=1 Tax=Microscilla marina ATCC 23134 TaxID=313606 RepID=A1ZJA3_MICM2|nr:hypothetical protein [Microscilla marina]EAY29639.1 lipoprotein, putative [Microscilla marina ATCC 23134]
MGSIKYYVSIWGWLALLWGCGSSSPRYTVSYGTQPPTQYEQVAKHLLDSLLNKALVYDQYTFNDQKFYKRLKENSTKRANSWQALFNAHTPSQKTGDYYLQVKPNGQIKVGWPEPNGGREGILHYLDHNFAFFAPLYMPPNNHQGNVMIMVDLQQQMTLAFAKYAWKYKYMGKHLSNVYLLDEVGMPLFMLVNNLPNEVPAKLNLLEYLYEVPSTGLTSQHILLQPRPPQTRLSDFTYASLRQAFALAKAGKYKVIKFLEGSDDEVFHKRPLWTED